MHSADLYDRYAHLPRPDWLGLRWSSTRRAACSCPLAGTIIELCRGQVRVEWDPCRTHPGVPFPPSWEPVDRGTPVKQPAPLGGSTLGRGRRRGQRAKRRIRLRS